MKAQNWPKLDYKEWKPTYETLHRYLQIVGKLRMAKTPCMNHSWHTTLFVSSRGLSTMAIPDGERNITVEFNFISHELEISTSDGEKTYLPLLSESVSSFYDRFKNCLKMLHINVYFYPYPNEVEDSQNFAEDLTHSTYNPEHAYLVWQAMVRANNVLMKFRADFTGKCSPVHFFWGSFDLAVTRFSGKKAPEHPGGVPHLPDTIAKEAYSEEVSSCGFWPGNEAYPHAAFYSYAYPEPEGFSNSTVEPEQAFYHQDLHEYILPYDVVINSHDPESVILSFLNSTFKIAGWKNDTNPYFKQVKIHQEAFSSREIT